MTYNYLYVFDSKFDDIVVSPINIKVKNIKILYGFRKTYTYIKVKKKNNNTF